MMSRSSQRSDALSYLVLAGVMANLLVADALLGLSQSVEIKVLLAGVLVWALGRGCWLLVISR